MNGDRIKMTRSFNKSNIVSYNCGLSLPTEMVDFFCAVTPDLKKPDFTNDIKTCCLLVEYIFVHAPYLGQPVMIDLAASTWLFAPLRGDDIEETDPYRYCIGYPRILYAWIRYYDGDRFEQAHAKLDLLFWWMIEEIFSSKNMEFENLLFTVLSSEFSIQNGSNKLINGYLLFYELPNLSSEYHPIISRSVLSNLKKHAAGIDIFPAQVVEPYLLRNDQNPINVVCGDSTYSVYLDSVFYDWLLSIENHYDYLSSDMLSLKLSPDLINKLFSNLKEIGMLNIRKLLMRDCVLTVEEFGKVISDNLNDIDDHFFKKFAQAYNKSIILSQHQKHDIFTEDENSFAPLDIRKFDSALVIGRHSGVLGIGEDARQFKKTFELIFSSVGVLDSEVHNQEFPLEHDLVASEFGVELCCMPPWDYLIERMRYPQLGRKSRNFWGYWPWELPKIPVGHEDFIFDDFDLIMTPSTFVTDCFSEKALCPVVTLTSPVTVPNVNTGNSEWCEKDAFTFLIMFDCNSSINRKNPFPAIHAFILEYSGRTDFQLIIRLVNYKANIVSDKFKYLYELITNHKNIKVIYDMMSYAEVCNLIASSDCYVSTHRSEGFGRIIAEAMLLYTPTIVSGWSGNTDFCTQETSFLVDGRLIEVKEGEYSSWSDQVWFEADVDSVRAQMCAVVSNGSRVIENACGLIKKNYSIEATANKIREIFNVGK